MVFCIVWIRIVVVTDWIRVHLPARDRVLAFHPAILSRIFSMMKSKARLSLPLTKIKTPRYFPKDVAIFKPSSFSRKPKRVWYIYWATKFFDLARLTFWPDSLQKVSKTLLIARWFFLVAFTKRSKSSAKNKWVKEGLSCEVFTPVQCPLTDSAWIRQAKYSIQRIKMYSDKASPCRIPREG